MTRQIKFRAWDGHKMYEPCIWIGKEYIPGRDTFIETELMQFTGLLDNNGKEIYENDWIRAYDSDKKEILHVIKWDNDNARFGAILKGDYMNANYSINQAWITEFKQEVIGNIHQNIIL